MSTIVEQNPPRHALESDSEEEFNPQRHDVQSKELEIRLVGNGVGPRSTLIIATRRAGAFWGKGAGLREQTGAVFVNGIEVGLVFNPEWTGANVIVSEVLSRLPVWAMHPYAQAIIDQLKPDRVALLDEYSVSSYISNQPASPLDAPIRYLSTTHFNPGTLAKPFAPPNVVDSTSASFISILSREHTCLGTLILLPSQKISKSGPQTIEPATLEYLAHGNEWPVETMVRANNLLVRAIGESESREWIQVADSVPKASAASQRSDLGEGGMYI